MAGHPERHADVTQADLAAALAGKAELADSRSSELYAMTKFCFEPRPYVEWVRASRAALLPVVAGIPGRRLTRGSCGARWRAASDPDGATTA